jgi:hypothetical protein
MVYSVHQVSGHPPRSLRLAMPLFRAGQTCRRHSGTMVPVTVPSGEDPWAGAPIRCQLHCSWELFLQPSTQLPMTSPWTGLIWTGFLWRKIPVASITNQWCRICHLDYVRAREWAWWCSTHTTHSSCCRASRNAPPTHRRFVAATVPEMTNSFIAFAAIRTCNI